jgi:hypothetical protein
MSLRPPPDMLPFFRSEFNVLRLRHRWLRFLKKATLQPKSSGDPMYGTELQRSARRRLVDGTDQVCQSDPNATAS